ncbi:exodeoxyribonuclease V subunit alpha [Limnohabitans sp. 63ED37-2]|uniref:exodeoxyribonuclease V subunit alpha n=1 Tax=Limnohabitans sp. 63ED37-2 TaxID=1678128 RepID=UPI0007062F51|nr:exodeoxyribonuclease V subunit alpha [Limnohabitans sp. 63ED37-2]ALK88897.1 RecBCD enzyme subunit RecD [Limnohabitans sp. 63ED37-2]
MSFKKPSRTMSVPTTQMDWLNDLPAEGLSAAQTLQWLQLWTEQGLLRHIDSALAAQLLRLNGQASPGLLVAAALLAQMEGRGYTCLPLADLCAPPVAMLGWSAVAVDGPQGLRALWAHLPATLADWQTALQSNTSRACSRLSDAPDQGQPLVLGGTAPAPLLYLRRYAGYEQRVGQGLLQRAREPLAVPDSAARQWLDRFFVPSTEAPTDTDWQKVACAVALRARLSVITGGPGTGKTYTAARLLALLLALHEGDSPLRVALAAPTGKAAARLKQSIDNALTSLQDQVPEGSGLDLNTLIARMGPARTLHSLLGARPDTRQFRHHAANPLDVDVLIVDEASMVHLEMMDALLQALPSTSRLVLLGDKDQLASVEAGAVLGDLCRNAAEGRYSAGTAQFVQAVAGQTLPAEYRSAGATPVLSQQTVMLRHSRRFKGAIGQLALAVNRGDAAAARAAFDPAVSAVPTPGSVSALLALQPTSPQAVCDLALGAHGQPSYADYLRLMQRQPEGQGTDKHTAWVRSVLQAFERFRILCAVHQGDWGTQGLNAAVQKALTDADLLKVTGEWFAGRPVMVTRNDAQLGVFNGDVGVVLPNHEGKLKVWFLDGEALRSVSVMRLAQVETAFVMTVHKSQGSEFEHTALVLPPGGAEVLSRELAYTGITRAREQFTLLEAEAGLLEAAMARPSVRASGLAQGWSQDGSSD